MKVTSPVLTQLGRALAGQALQEESDGIISVPPVFLMGGEIPQPVFRQTGSATADIRPTSHIISHVQALNASTNSNLSFLSEGLWDVIWSHFIELAGAVGDITSVSDFKINVGALGPSTLSRFRGDLTTNQQRSGSFRISVQKGQEITLTHTTTGGAGTSTQSGWVVFQANRLF